VPPDIDRYKDWTPAAQERALQRLKELQNAAWRPFFCNVRGCDGSPHGDWSWNHARADQQPPPGDRWLTWLMMSGRGAGKTRTGNEWVHKMVEQVPRVALVAPTSGAARDVLLEGESGLLRIAAPGKRPLWEPSKRRLTWPNGAVGSVFSAEEPDRLRGPEHGAALCDEACFYPLVQDVWDNLLFGLRMGKAPKVMVTTTPSPSPWLKALLADERTVLSRASTYDNLANLSPVFAERIISKYEGTRLGRQELLAEVLTDVQGALWTWELVEAAREAAAPDDFDRVVVAVDPAGTDKKSSDETGIVVAGIRRGVVYIVADRSGRYSPHAWAVTVRDLYEEYSADAVVAETNFGADMVEHTLRTSGVKARIVKISARRSKKLRAEPVLGLYEQGRVKHCGVFKELEDQMCEWVPFSDQKSPDRLDAMVYAVSAVSQVHKAYVASPLRLINGGAA